MKIRFRVWDGEKMVYPSDIRGDRLSNAAFAIKQIGDLIGYFQDKDSGERWWYTDLDVAHTMLSTGRKDRNGKEIYDGDIVVVLHEDGEKVTCLVFWSGNMASFALKELDGWDPLTKTGGWRLDAVYEVIGNRYENTELMKGQTT